MGLVLSLSISQPAFGLERTSLYNSNPGCSFASQGLSANKLEATYGTKHCLPASEHIEPFKGIVDKDDQGKIVAAVLRAGKPYYSRRFFGDYPNCSVLTRKARRANGPSVNFHFLGGVHFANMRILGLVDAIHPYRWQKFSVDLVGWGLAGILVNDIETEQVSKETNLCRINMDVCSCLRFANFTRNAICVSGSLQRLFGLTKRKNDQDNARRREEGGGTSNQVSPPSKIRRFFSSEGGAPLSAQIGGVVVFSLITIIGLYIGMRRIIEGRRSGWAYLCSGILAYAIFLGWSSPS